MFNKIKEEFREKHSEFVNSKLLYSNVYGKDFVINFEEEQEFIENFIIYTMINQEKKAINEMQEIVQSYFKNVINLPCPDFRLNMKHKDKLNETD